MWRQEKYFKSLNLLFTITNPLLLVIFLNIVALILFIFIPNKFVKDFAYENKILSYKSFLLYILFIIFFSLGYLFVPSLKKYKKNSFLFKYQIRMVYKELKFFAYATFFLTILGYLIWFKDIYLHFNYYLSLLLTVGAYHIRDLLLEKMISGITTFTQFGIISSILFLIIFLLTKRRIYILFIIIIIILALLRVIFFGERLAVLEIVIPLIFIYLRFYPEKTLKFLFIIFLGFLIIWSTELFRSYMSPTYHNAYTPFEFLIYRLAMYFITTLNNCFLIFEKFPIFTDFMPATLKFFYKIFHLPNNSQYIYIELLSTNLNPEYNNKSAWGILYFDFGYFGFIIAFLIGGITRLLYSSYKKANLWGIMLYPIFLIFLFQSYRILYINSSRVFYPYLIIFLLILIYYFKISYYKKNKKKSNYHALH